MIQSLDSKKIFIFDMDGTISLGGQLFPASNPLFRLLIQQGKRVYIMTNNSSRTTPAYMEKLEKMGLDMTGIEILSSLDLAIDFLRDSAMNNVCWIANDEVSTYLQKVGFTYNDTNPDCLLLTYDTQINYEKLLKATELLNNGIPYYATHIDNVCPTELGYPVPDIGTYIETIRITTGKTPLATFGKPALYAINAIRRQNSGVELGDIVFVGDRLYTDIQFAINAGITSVLTLSGETDIQMYEKSAVKADLVVENIGEMMGMV